MRNLVVRVVEDKNWFINIFRCKRQRSYGQNYADILDLIKKDYNIIL
jgi:hypothetical protein